MKTKEQVKQNKLTIADALNLVSPPTPFYTVAESQVTEQKV